MLDYSSINPIKLADGEPKFTENNTYPLVLRPLIEMGYKTRPPPPISLQLDHSS